MQRLAHVADEVDNVFQSGEPPIIGSVGGQDLELPFDGANNAVAIGTVPAFVVSAIPAREIHVVPRRLDGFRC